MMERESYISSKMPGPVALLSPVNREQFRQWSLLLLGVLFQGSLLWFTAHGGNSAKH